LHQDVIINPKPKDGRDARAFPIKTEKANPMKILIYIPMLFCLFSCSKSDDSKIFGIVRDDEDSIKQTVKTAKESNPKVRWVELRNVQDQPDQFEIVTHTSKPPKDWQDGDKLPSATPSP
jgi:hypothetical protein